MGRAFVRVQCEQKLCLVTTDCVMVVCGVCVCERNALYSREVAKRRPVDGFSFCINR